MKSHKLKRTNSADMKSRKPTTEIKTNTCEQHKHEITQASQFERYWHEIKQAKKFEQHRREITQANEFEQYWRQVTQGNKFEQCIQKKSRKLTVRTVQTWYHASQQIRKVELQVSITVTENVGMYTVPKSANLMTSQPSEIAPQPLLTVHCITNHKSIQDKPYNAT